jgi:type II secretory pathway pseudopilin PulG
VKKAQQKLNSQTGFTLAETLITVLILLMVSAVVAGGVPAAANAYAKAVDAANAHVLLSTTVDALRSELSTAWDVENLKSDEAGEKGITYYSSATGSQSKIYISDSDGKIMLQEYVDLQAARKEETSSSTGASDSTVDNSIVPARPIVSDAMTIKGKLTIGCGDDGYISYNKTTGIVTVKGLQVKKGDQTIVKMPEAGLTIRVITKEASS